MVFVEDMLNDLATSYAEHALQAAGIDPGNPSDEAFPVAVHGDVPANPAFARALT